MVPQYIAGWFIVKNPIYKWMMTGGTPMTEETSIIRTDIVFIHDDGWMIICRSDWMYVVYKCL